VSLNDILNSAVSGLAASQAGMGTVSNNIANVNTPGYAREKTRITTNVATGRVSGVTVAEPERVADRFLESTVYRRGGDAGQAEIISNYLDQLQSYLGAPSDADTDAPPSGLPDQLSDLLAKATEMTGTQDPGQGTNQFINSTQSVIDSINQMSDDVDALRSNAASSVSDTVNQINDLLSQIYTLNGTISQVQSLGRNTSGPADERMSALQKLSGLVNVTVRQQPDGKVTIETASGQVLLDNRLRQLSYPNGDSGAHTTYPPIDVRFVNAAGGPGASTGDKIDSSAVGGTLGGLLQLRDQTLPAFAEKMGVIFGGLAQTMNSASNAGSTVPAPASLQGRPSGLVGGDRLGFTGNAVFAVTAKDGTILAKTSVDFDALGPGATVNDAVNAINAGLGGAATASLAADGTLSITASDPNTGVVVAQDPADPSARAGVGFSQYFGLNDIIRSDSNPLVPSGFTTGDPSGFGSGQTAQIVLRDAAGKELGNYTFNGAAGQTFGDVITGLNASPLGGFGSFALDDRGQIRFTPTQAYSGASITIPSDSTNRSGTGLTFSALSGLTGGASGLSSGHVRPDIATNASNLALARFRTDAAVGAKGLGAGDTSGATSFIDSLNGQVNLGKDGKNSIDAFAQQVFASAGSQAALAKDTMTDTAARRDDAINRRDTFSGVNIDEELANMVVLQNSYSAAARVLNTAGEMYDTLINMVG
jgi:flagellar hook-associated protein 1 FlgK